MFLRENIENVNAHYNFTASEIIKDLPNIDGFFSTYGTSGTLIGAAKKIKEYNKNIQVISVIPNRQNHNIPGIYSNAKLKYFDKSLIDKTIKIEEVEAYKILDYLAKTEGITVGISSALAISDALPSPTIPATFSLPLRNPFSWKPPSKRGLTLTDGAR